MKELLIKYLIATISKGYIVKDAIVGVQYDKRFFLDLVKGLREKGLSSDEILDVIKDIYL